MRAASNPRMIICVAVVACLLGCLLIVQPVSQPKAQGQVLAALTLGAQIIGAIAGTGNFILGIFNRAHGDKTAEELRKLQAQMDKQNEMLVEIQKQLTELQRSVDTLARNLEIDTKEIQSYVQSIGAQNAINSIATHYDELATFAGHDLTKMTKDEIDQLNVEVNIWATNVLGTWDIKKMVKQIQSAICPDVPGIEGVLELWTDQAILKMPPPSSASNDFSVKVESRTPGTGNSLLPVVAELPQYFDYNGMEGGDLSPGEKTPETTWYFAEGTCRPGFTPYVCINNPGNIGAAVEITYMQGNGSVVKQSIDVAARSRSTVTPKAMLAEGDDAAHDFSTVVQSTNKVPIVAAMPQYFAFQGEKAGGIDVDGVNSPAPEWYLAEGTCRPDFDTFITIMNPSDRDTAARLTYMKGDGATAQQVIPVPAHSRATVKPQDIMGVADDAAHDFSTRVQSVNGAGLVVARPMYFDYGGVWEGGTCATAVTGPSTAQYLAEGTCRSNFDTFIAIQNPSDKDTAARLTYMKGDGTTVEQVMPVRAHSRATVKPEDIMGEADDAAHDFSTRVRSVNGVGLIVERPEYFLYNGMWEGGSCALGAPEPTTTEYFAEGTTRPGFDPYITIQNPNDKPVLVRLTYMWGDKNVTTEDRRIPANARDTVSVSSSPAAGTVTRYYESLADYFETLLYYQQKGMDLICEAYNRKYLTTDQDPPAAQVREYIQQSYRKLLQQELAEFMRCVETLVVSWSYVYTPNALVPQASAIFADADSLYMNINNGLLCTGKGTEKNFYGAFGRAFKRTSDPQYNTAPGIFAQGPGLEVKDARQTWFPVALKFYDRGQQKLLTDQGSIGVVRYQQNCEPGAYRAGMNNGLMISGGAKPTADKTFAFQVQNQGTSGEGDPKLPFGSFTFMCQPRGGVLAQFGGKETPEEMPANLKAGYLPAIAATVGGDFCAYLEPGSKPGCGQLKGWGDSSSGKLSFPAGDDFVQLSAGFQFCTALRSDGSIVAWGGGSYGETKYPKGNDFMQVAAGSFHGVALKKDGSLAMWGDNSFGQQRYPTGNDFVQVAGGKFHSLALKSDGSVVGWGANTVGQCNSPGGNDFVQVAAGEYHSIGLKKDGTVVGWGHNQSGQINCPTGNDFVSVAASGGCSLALKKDGTVVGWGDNAKAQSAAPGGPGGLAIAAGTHCSLFISGGFGVTGWGGNYYGQINCPGGSDFAQISVAYYQGLALKKDGSIVGWGRNDEGILNPPAGNDFVQVSCYDTHALALKKDGSIVGWGSNRYGGINCPAGNDFVQVSAGNFHSLALRKDGSIVGWGLNSDGQINCPAGKDFVQVAAGSNYSLAVRKDGSIVGWGWNRDGQCNCPGGKEFVQVATGCFHGIALRNNGSIVGWGYNAYGQTNCPGGNDFVQVSAGRHHNLALRKDGSVVGWGEAKDGALACPAGKEYFKVAAGYEFSIALKKAPFQPWKWR
jgi:alpha-tubulin suppressor-like RCC1 family protein